MPSALLLAAGPTEGPKMRSPAAAAIVLAVVTSGALMAGCSNGGPAPAPTVTVTKTTTPSTPAAAPSSPTPAAAGPAACQFSALKVALGPGNAAAGSQIVPIQFTNVSSSTCTLYGFP